MLQNCSMLADLTIHRWTATKHDKTVSLEVERTHQAKDAGRYNKALIDKAHLATIDALGNQLRAFHYRHTLPWTDKGARLLPTKLFGQYQEGFASLRDQRNKAVEDFLLLYPTLVQAARHRLNTMFDPGDYPQVSELREAFGVQLEIMPVPNASDFRLDIINDQLQTSLRLDVIRAIEHRQAQATKDCWARVREVVGRIAEQCSKAKPRIHDSLMENASDLALVLDGLNVTGDGDIAEVAQELHGLVVDPERLRNSPVTRVAVATAAEKILQRIPS